jgi:hypothetical protein
VLQDQGDMAGALASYEAALEIRQRLMTAAPNYLELQHDVAGTRAHIATIQIFKGDRPAAHLSLEEGQRLTTALLAQQPDNQTLKQDAAWFAARLKELDAPK